MSEATRTRTHTPEVRQRAVEILQEGVGHRALAAKLGIPQATARQWARAYAVGGADAVLNAGARHHTYSYDVKLAVVKDRLENGLTVREAMIKHKIPSESSVKAWCRQYRDGGADALIDKPRGRKPRVKQAEQQEGAPTGAHFSCRANYLDRREPIGISSSVANQPRAVARAPVAAIGGASPLCSNADRLLTPYA